ncbi:S1 RNA-binding domain-containing protein [Candidatus Parcubacteria bacterium]|nr:MAG: S1 RNA-binding domain-containing protein [Candidatus Parcubacteria bacterium]
MMPKAEGNGKTNAMLAQILKNGVPGSEWPKEGVVLEVELIKKAPRQLFFDMGKFGTGIVYGLELLNAREIARNLNVGDRLSAKITNLHGEGGYTELSLAEADKQRVWQQVKELQESGEVVKARVFAANAGGLSATLGDLDVKAFLPVSQLSNDHYPRVEENDRLKIAEELKKFIGEELNVKIIDVNPRANKLIISEREVLSANVKELLAKYQPGQVIDGLVTGIADFGVFIRFVDDPQIEGMIHISELEHRIVDSPKEIVKVNEAVKVKVIDIKDGKVFLSLKALKADPWETIGNRYTAGQDVEGVVYKLNPFGAVINLGGGLQGMIHISEFGGTEEMKKELVIGQPRTFVVDSVKPEEKRIVLKLKK